MTQSRASTPAATVGAHSTDIDLPGLPSLLPIGAAPSRTTGKPSSAAGRSTDPSDPAAASLFASAAQSPAATDVTGQLIEFTISNNRTYYVNSDGTSGRISAESLGGAIAVDSVLGIQFKILDGGGSTQGRPSLFIGSLAQGAGAATRSADFENYYLSHFNQDPYTTSPGLSLTVDTANHKLYTFIGSANTSDNTMLVADYSVDSSGQVHLANIHSVENSTGNQAPSFFNGGAVFDGRTGNVYVADANLSDTSENGIFRISASGGQPVSIVNAAGLDRVSGVALDRPDDRLYFSTINLGSNGSGSTGHLYVVLNPDSASNRQPMELRYAANVTPPTLRGIHGIAYDENAHVLYVGNDYDAGSPATQYSRSVLEKFQLDSTGTVVIGITEIPYTSISSQDPNQSPFDQSVFIPLSNLTLNGTATAAMSDGTRVTLLTGTPMITDYGSGGYLASANVSIRDAGQVVAGDRLGLSQNGTFTSFTSTATQYIDHGHTFLVSYANGTLTIANMSGSAGENTIAAYQQILADIQYSDGSTDFNDRTVTVQVNNGAIGNPTGSLNSKGFTIDIVPQDPTIRPGGFATAGVEGQTATGGSGSALAGDSDPNGGTLSITKVNGQAGGVGAAVAGQYGELTLNADGSYSYVADNTAALDAAASGSRPTDSFTFTVTTSEGSSANETFNVTIDRAPDVGGDGTTVSFTKGDPAVTVDAGLTVADRDGDTIASATASIAGVQAGDTLGLTADAVAAAGDAGITVSYGNGTVTLSGNASAATYQAILQGLTYSSSADDPTVGGTDTSRTIQVSVSDGTTSSTVASNTVDVFDTSTTEVSYTNGTVYDPTNSTPVTVTAFTGVGTSYTVVVTSSTNGTTLSIDNGSRTQDIAFNQSQVAFKLDYSDNTAAVSLTGGDYGDTLIGGSGNDTLVGGAGNDILSGGLGTNTIDGGADTNTVSYADYAGGGGVTVNLTPAPGSTSGTATATGLSDTLLNIQNVIGSDGNDVLRGGTGRNVLEGGMGADRLIGGAGDFASYVHAASGVHADLSGLTTNTGDAAGDTYVGIENLYGSQFDDTLIGDARNNIISGLGGADTIDGGLGNDTIRLSTNPTKVDGGGGTDTLVIGAGAGISLTDDNCTGIERVVVFGDATLDMAGVTSDVPSLIRSYSMSGESTDITGTAGADRIFGGKGNDILSGGGGGTNGTTDGNDVFIAGSGSETFNELMAGFGRDVIYKADLSKDTFDVAGLAADASHLHFAIINHGADTLVYGDAGRDGDALVLKGITAADNAQANGHFTFTPAST